MVRVSHLLALLVALAAIVSAACATTASATWTNTGDTAFTATAGPTTLFTPSAATLTCTGETLNATAGTSSTSPTWNVFFGTTTGTGCRIAGVPTALSCTFVYTAMSYTSGFTSGTLVLTPSPQGCTVSQGGRAICTLSGNVTSAVYANPTAPSTFGTFSTPSNTQLSAFAAPSSTCPFGTRVVVSWFTRRFTITAATGGASTPHLGPILIFS